MDTASDETCVICRFWTKLHDLCPLSDGGGLPLSSAFCQGHGNAFFCMGQVQRMTRSFVAVFLCAIEMKSARGKSKMVRIDNWPAFNAQSTMKSMSGRGSRKRKKKKKVGKTSVTLMQVHAHMHAGTRAHAPPPHTHTHTHNTHTHTHMHTHACTHAVHVCAHTHTHTHKPHSKKKGGEKRGGGGKQKKKKRMDHRSF